MRLARFTHEGRTRVGVVDPDGDTIADLGATGIPDDVGILLASGPDAVERAREASSGAARIPITSVVLRAPVGRPSKFLAIGLNYRDHIEETGMETPEFPVFFNKQNSCVAGPGEAIHVPRVSSMVDYEGELGVVIGRRCRHVPAERAGEVVAGYVIVNDVSVRDWQFRAPTMTLGKSFDTHGPIGPWMVTADEITDPHRLTIHTRVNDELLQSGSTSEMVFDIWTQIEVLTTAFTLEPGDVISTGTPAGVGVARRPQRFLEPGDTVSVQIDGIGMLENPVIEEPPDPTALGETADRS